MLLIPFFLSRFLIFFWQKTKLKKIQYKLLAFLSGVLWLLFIPNSAYIITEVRHLLDFCPANNFNVCIENAWMIMFFFTYALIGWISYVYLLNQMEYLISMIWPKLGRRIYISTIIPFISLGVMLGLINRWNSWEVFTAPYGLINDLIRYFTDLTYFINWILFTIFLYFLYFVGIYIIKKKPNYISN